MSYLGGAAPSSGGNELSSMAAHLGVASRTLRNPRASRLSTTGLALLAESRGQPAEELASAEDVEGEDRQGGEDDGREDGGHVDAVLALERPQRQRQGPLVRALGEDQ